MALTTAQKVSVAVMIFETYATVDRLTSSLIPEVEAYIVDRIEDYPFDSFVKLQGGSDGIDFDNERKREAIRREIRDLLGLSLISDKVSDGNFTQMIPVHPVF